MKLPSGLFAIAFRAQRLGAMLAGVMAIMVYLASLAMALQAGLSTATRGWDLGLRGRLTVEIPALQEATDGAEAAPDSRRQAVLDFLKKQPDVESAVPVAPGESARLLKPWISDPSLLASLPLPLLVDVRLRPGASLSAEEAQEKLASLAPDARVDDHAEWLGRLRDAVQGLCLIAWLMMALTALALLVAVHLICRSALAVQRDTVELLHLLGAADALIAREIERSVLRLAAPAALGGFALAALTLAALALPLRPVLDSAALPPSFWLALSGWVLAVPLGAVGAAFGAARFSARALLRSSP